MPRRTGPFAYFIRSLVLHWHLLGLGLAALVAGVVINLTLPLLFRDLIAPMSAGTVDLHEVPFPWTVVTLIILLLVIQGCVFFGRTWCFALLGQRVGLTLRYSLFSTIVDRETIFFDRNSKVDITSRLFADVQLVTEAVHSKLSIVLRYGLQAMGAIALMVFLSPLLSLVLLCSLPIALILGFVLSRRLRILMRVQQQEFSTMSQVADEALELIRVVKTFGTEQLERGKFQKALANYFAATKKRYSFSAFFSSFINFLLYATLIIVVTTGLFFVSSGDLAVEDFTAFLLYAIIAGVSFAFLTSGISEFLQAFGALERLTEFGASATDGAISTDSVTDFRNSEDQDEEMFHTSDEYLFTGIELTDVSFSYPGERGSVLSDVNFVFEAPGAYCIAGPSGAGKSTLLQLLLGLYEPSTGTMRYSSSQDSFGQHYREHLPSLAYVPQETALFSTSLLENARYGSAHVDEERVRALCDEVGLGELIDSLPEGIETCPGPRSLQLSGGQKQRLAIVRALLRAPAVLVLDEATAALDGATEEQVLALVRRLLPQSLILIVSHRQGVLRFCDHLLLLEAGSIADSGTATNTKLVARAFSTR